MKKMFLAVMALTMLATLSCKKDNSTPTNTPPPASKLLAKITKKEGNVTTVFNFNYDANKRLQSFKSADGQTGVTFTYDGNGNLVKLEDMEDDLTNVYTYVYANGLPVSGTFKSWQKTAGEPDYLVEDDQLTYTVTNGQVTKIHLAFGQTADSEDFTLSYSANGNLTKVVAANGGYTANFTLGTKKPVFPQVTNFVLDQAGLSYQFAAKNELLTIAFDFPGTQFDHTISNQYTYDADGYVLTSNDGSAQIQFQYQ